MTLLATIGLKLLGVGRFLKALPWPIWAALGAALVLLFAWHLHAGQVQNAYNTAFDTGFRSAIATVKAEQAKADAEARKRAAVTVKAQTKINTESSNALLDANADIDARAAELRVRRTQAARRHDPAGAGDPAAQGSPAARACPAPAQDGLAWDVALPLMVQAAKNDAQLNAILDWEEKQQALAELDPVE